LVRKLPLLQHSKNQITILYLVISAELKYFS